MVYGAFQNGVRVEASSVYSTPYRFVKATPVRAPLNVQAENNTSYDKMPYFSRDTVPFINPPPRFTSPYCMPAVKSLLIA